MARQRRACMVAYASYLNDARIKNYVDALVKAGWQVDVLALGTGDASSPNVRVASLMSKVVSSRAGPYLLSLLEFFVRALFKVSKGSAGDRYDVVHVHNMPNFIVFSALVAKLRGALVILDVHDTMPEAYATKFDLDLRHPLIALLRLEERISAAFADVVITTNDLHRASLVGHGVPQRKIHLIMNVGNPAIFRPRAHLRGDAPGLVLGYHGTVAQRLGLDLVVEAVRRALPTCPGLRFVVLGDGELMPHLRRQVADAGLEDVVSLRGWVAVEDLPRALEPVDVGVVGNRRQTELRQNWMLPVKMLEYAAMEIPTIAPRLRVIEHYFDDTSALLYEPDDVDDLARAIRAVYTDRAVWTACARACAPLTLGTIGRRWRLAISRWWAVRRGSRAVDCRAARGGAGRPVVGPLRRPDPAATAFHRPIWASLLAECYSLRASALVLSDDTGQIIGGLPVVRTHVPLRGARMVCLPFTDNCGPLVAAPAVLERLANAIAVWRTREQTPPLQVRAPMPAAGGWVQRQAAVLHTLALSADPASVFQTFRKTRVQQCITRAERAGVTVRRAESCADLRLFYELHVQTRRRLGTPVQPWRFFRLLWERVLAGGLGFAQLAIHQERVIAGAVFLAWNDTLIYKYSASDPAFWSLRPNNLLLWTAIRWGCTNGFRLFDFGRSDLDNRGLRDFKDGWGTREKPLLYSTLGSAVDGTRPAFAGQAAHASWLGHPPLARVGVPRAGRGAVSLRGLSRGIHDQRRDLVARPPLGLAGDPRRAPRRRGRRAHFDAATARLCRVGPPARHRGRHRRPDRWRRPGARSDPGNLRPGAPIAAGGRRGPGRRGSVDAIRGRIARHRRRPTARYADHRVDRARWQPGSGRQSGQSVGRGGRPAIARRAGQPVPARRGQVADAANQLAQEVANRAQQLEQARSRAGGPRRRGRCGVSGGVV